MNALARGAARTAVILKTEENESMPVEQPHELKKIERMVSKNWAR
ncbi:hypothetical protein [Legionella waltersii]|nr:hypothetical protein [Legionella waltersii]